MPEATSIAAERHERTRDSRFVKLREQLETKHPNPHQRTYITDRWFNRVEKSDRQKTLQMNRFYIVRWASVAAAASLPAFVALDQSSASENMSVIQIVTIGLSILVALSTSFLHVTRVGQRWQLSTRTRDLLEREAWRAVAEVDKYSDLESDIAFSVFVDSVEAILEDAEHGYYAEVASVADLQNSSGSNRASGNDEGQ